MFFEGAFLHLCNEVRHEKPIEGQNCSPAVVNVILYVQAGLDYPPTERIAIQIKFSGLPVVQHRMSCCWTINESNSIGMSTMGVIWNQGIAYISSQHVLCDPPEARCELFGDCE